MINKIKEVFSFRTLVSKTGNIFKIVTHQLDRYFGVYGRLLYFLGIQTLFGGNGYKNQWSKKALHYRFIYNFKFCTDTFLQFNWSKEIWVSDKTGFTIDDSIVHRWPKEERQRVTENRSLYLYSPWIIDTYYKYSAPDKRVVVEDQYGDEIIETHNFTGGVKRRKLPWWNSYRVRDRWSDDMTEFDRQCDEHITRGY